MQKILPNLNVYAEQEEPDAAPLENSKAESVIALAKEQGTFTRKDVEKSAGNQPYNLRTIIETNSRKWTDCSGRKKQKYTLSPFKHALALARAIQPHTLISNWMEY